MGDPTDFTFCQVGSRVDDGKLESPKTIPNIKDSILEDNISDDVGILKIDDTIQDDNLHDTSSSSELKPSGSLSNNSSAILPPEFQLRKSLMQKPVADRKDLVEGSQEKNPIVKKPVARAKVPFEKGYSQMDWLKLTHTQPDLAGLKGQSNRRLVSMDEVWQHRTEGSIWTVLKGRVYNISPYMKFHPGGVDMLMKAAGKDSTSLFNKYHAWVNFEFLLEKCLVGVLDDSL